MPAPKAKAKVKGVECCEVVIKCPNLSRRSGIGAVPLLLCGSDITAKDSRLGHFRGQFQHDVDLS